MAFSLSSFIASSIATTILIYVLYFLMHRTKRLLKFGILCVYGLTMLVLLRGILPFDFYGINLTTSFYSYTILPVFQKFYIYELISLGQYTITLEHFLLILWLLGSVFFLLKRIYGYRLYRNIIYFEKDLGNEEVQDVLNQSFYTLFPHKENKCRVIQSDMFGSPAIWGFLKPVIILPTILYSRDELKYIFLHELLHYKHKDFLIKEVVDFLVAIHWWNPFIHQHLFPVVNQAQELLVDYVINKNLTSDQKTTYLEVLSRSVKHAYALKSNTSYTYALVDGHSQSNMMQRLQCIIAHKVKGVSFIGILLSVFMFLLSFTFVFEPSNEPKYDEFGNKVFYKSENNSYYIQNGSSYNLYLSGEYVYTAPHVIDSFKELPIYNSLEEIR